MTPSGSHPPKITRPRLVVLTLAAFAVLGLTLVAMYFFFTVLLGLPRDTAVKYVEISGVLCLAAAVLGTYQNFRRYWARDSAPPRPLDPRLSRSLAVGSLVVASGALASAYLLVHNALFFGIALSGATGVGGLFLVSRLRRATRD